MKLYNLFFLALHILLLADYTQAINLVHDQDHAVDEPTLPEWQSCHESAWVPYRKDGAADAPSSFYACIDQAETKPGWDSSHLACQSLNASLAWWTEWKQLAFYYNVFQQFKQTLTSPTFFMVMLNLRDKPFPAYKSYYSLYNRKTKAIEHLNWDFNKETMIKIQHRRYVQTPETYRLDLNCAAFRMEKDNFIDSDIDFVPCDEQTYTDSLVFDIQNDLKHFLCRKDRARCPAVHNGTLGNNVVRMEGVYTYYYGTMRKRQQAPNTNLLVNKTVCHLGCGEISDKVVHYYTGDWIRYWCTPGYRSLPTLQSWEPNYAVCNEDGEWEFIYCSQTLCDSVECMNGGTAYNAYGRCLCDCAAGYTGLTCNVLVDDYPCHSNPCLNGGKCIVAESKKDFYCECVGALGERCEYELNECTSNPCAEGSLCIDGENGYTCLCDPFRMGKHCAEVVPFCTRFIEPCKNGAECYSCNVDTFKKWCEQDNRTQFLCNCKQGYTGLDCSLEIDQKPDAWQIFSVVLGCMLFIIISLMCEIIGSRRRHDIDNLQVLLESIDGYLKQQQNAKKGLKKPVDTPSKPIKLSDSTTTETFPPTPASKPIPPTSSSISGPGGKAAQPSSNLLMIPPSAAPPKTRRPAPRPTPAGKSRGVSKFARGKKPPAKGRGKPKSAGGSTLTSPGDSTPASPATSSTIANVEGESVDE